MNRRLQVVQGTADIARSEHLERYHSPYRRCLKCGRDFPNFKKEEVTVSMSAHLSRCRETMRDMESSRTLMTEEQYEQLSSRPVLLSKAREAQPHERAYLRNYETIWEIFNAGRPIPPGGIPEPGERQCPFCIGDTC
jgi:hypothetical protein